MGFHGVTWGAARKIRVSDHREPRLIPVVGNLNTQRNAIRMLYERIIVLVQYVDAVLGSEHISSDGTDARNG
jgi:hypothetical protein